MPIGTVQPFGAAVKQVLPYGVPASSDLVAAATAANQAAIVAIAADAKPTYISELLWSYSGAPTAGRLTLQATTGGTVYDGDITIGGPGFVPFSPPLMVGSSQAVTATLAAAGAGVTGKVNVVAWKLE